MTITEFIDTGSGLNDACLIYKLTNTKNNKVYIGQTKNSLRKRIIAHITHSKNNTKSKKHHLQFALQKYGYDNFQIDIVEVCKQEQLNEREIFWISYYHSTDPKKGYNCTNGGDGCSIAREIKQSTRDKISLANKLKWQDKEYRKQQIESRIKAKQRRSKKIVQLTYQYELIKIWNNKKDINSNFSSQIYDLRKDRKYILTCGYIWMYLEDYNKLLLREPLLVQLDKEYNIVHQYYEYTPANLVIQQLSGNNGKLKFNLNQKFTKMKGTKKAGYIWMLYDSYKKIKSK